MNILLTTSQGGVSGATYSISYLALELAKRKHQVYVLCREKSLLHDLLVDSEVKVITSTYQKAEIFSEAYRWRQLSDRLKLDLINPQSSFDRYIGVVAKWVFRVHVPIVHTRRQRPRKLAPWKMWLFRVSTSKFIAVSDAIKERLMLGGVPGNHVEVVANGTPPEKYERLDPKLTNELRRRYQLNDEIVIGCVSRMKLQSHILKALKYLGKPVTVLFVGIDRTPELEALEKDLPYQHRIIYCGEVDQREVLHLFPLFSMKILPSRIEGLSQSLLEGMAMGIPVIATKLSGNISLIQHEENGLLYEEDNPQQLAHQIEALTADTNLRKRLITNGKQTALEKYSITTTADNYEALVRRLVNAQ